MFHKTCLKCCFTDKVIRNHSKIQQFFKDDPNLSEMQKYIPTKYLKYSQKIANDHLYMVCPNAAKKVADHVVTCVKGNQIIAETNTGIGLITTELLENGIPRVRMYETCTEFREDLKKFATVYPGRVELFIKNIFHLARFAYMDKQEGTNRVDSLLKNVPKKAWTDDPAMTVIGTMPDRQFIKYLMKCLALQTGPALYGRMQIFGIMKKHDYQSLTATPQDTLRLYQHSSVMFQLIFDYEKLETFPRNIFLPWERSVKKIGAKACKKKSENDEMVLLKINFKKDFTVSVDQLLKLSYFVKQLYGTGNNLVVPTAEKWVPGSGLNILLPKLKHDDYFYDLNVFTKFRELTPPQILGVFKELINSPDYTGSPFTSMIENELIKSETIETSLADAVLEKKIIKDVENLNYQDEIE